MIWTGSVLYGINFIKYLEKYNEGALTWPGDMYASLTILGFVYLTGLFADSITRLIYNKSLISFLKSPSEEHKETISDYDTKKLMEKYENIT
ncbi:hypothetical protein JW949_00625 [Candidatus Woesearchaeota archaeon]|nr:hypothetical protein [Candidatus Woesearchaeota archaeon]